METEEFKEVLLQVLELQLEYQLRAIRQLRGKPEVEPVLTPRRGRERWGWISRGYPEDLDYRHRRFLPSISQNLTSRHEVPKANL